jgi:hypothetical protein
MKTARFSDAQIYFVLAFGIADCDRVAAGRKFAFPLVAVLSRFRQVRGRHVA